MSRTNEVWEVEVDGKKVAETPLVSWGTIRRAYNSRPEDSARLAADHHPKDARSLLAVSKGIPIGYIPSKMPGRNELYDAVMNKREVVLRIAGDVRSPQPELPLTRPAEEALSAWDYLYRVTKVTYLKPNPQKGPYSRNWRGYLMLTGRYWDGERVAQFEGKQVSVVEFHGQLMAKVHNPSNHLYTGQCDLAGVGDSRFIRLCTFMLGKLDMNEVGSTTGLFYHKVMNVRWGKRKE